MSKHLVEMRGGRGGREEYGESGQYDFQSSPRGTYTSHASPPASPRGSLDLDDPEMFDDEEDFKSLPKVFSLLFFYSSSLFFSFFFFL